MHLPHQGGRPIALQFNAAGYHTFVLDYSVAPRRHPQPLLDASRAMCIIRKNAEEWNVDSEKLQYVGFRQGASCCKPWSILAQRIPE